jgi:hypothetical protein
MLGPDIAGSGALFGAGAGMGGAVPASAAAGMGGFSPFTAALGGSSMAYPFAMPAAHSLNPMLASMGMNMMRQSQQQPQAAPAAPPMPMGGRQPMPNQPISQPMPYAQMPMPQFGFGAMPPSMMGY